MMFEKKGAKLTKISVLKYFRRIASPRHCQKVQGVKDKLTILGDIIWFDDPLVFIKRRQDIAVDYTRKFFGISDIRQLVSCQVKNFYRKHSTFRLFGWLMTPGADVLADCVAPGQVLLLAIVTKVFLTGYFFDFSLNWLADSLAGDYHRNHRAVTAQIAGNIRQ